MLLTIRTRKKTQFIEITEQVRDAVRQASIRDGVCHVFALHTTAAVTINENADPSVLVDMEAVLDALVPRDAGYRHLEGNSAAHVKASLVGASEMVAIENGQMVLGVWQGVFLCEFDGPRTRNVNVQVIASR